MNIINQIFYGDCIRIMKSIPDNFINMILCDLPYGITARNKWDSIIPFTDLWSAYCRIIKPNAAIVLTSCEPFTSKLINSNLSMFKYDLIWIKNKKTGFLNANKMPLRQHENICVFYKKLPVYNPQKTVGHSPVHGFTKHSSDGTNYGRTKCGFSGGGSTSRHPASVLYFPVVNNDSEDKKHPTQKPVELFDYLIKTYTNEGDVVLDNCIGSGTTAISCLRTNRRFVGIEKDEKYYHSCLERIKEYHKSQKAQISLNTSNN